MVELPRPKDDGLHIPEVGEWSRDKHYYLRRYIDAFTTAMKDKKWRGLHYIDLFAGAGIERLDGSQELQWGSPMIAAHFQFARLHLCEKDPAKCSALTHRMGKVKPNSRILCGDANEKIDEIVAEVPQHTLSLAFLDPYGLHLEYETIRKLSVVRADLIVFFPDHLDAVRNWEKYYLRNHNSNLDRCLGSGCDWRSIVEETARVNLAEVLRELYVKQIESLGYSHFEYQRIESRGHPLYVLILCSHSPVAAKLWRRIALKQANDQRMLPF